MKMIAVFLVALFLVGTDSERIYEVSTDQHLHYPSTTVIVVSDGLGYEQASSISDDGRSLTIHVTLTVLKTTISAVWSKLPATITNVFKLEQVLALLDVYYTVSEKAEDLIKKVLYEITCRTPIPGCNQALASLSAKVIMWLLPI